MTVLPSLKVCLDLSAEYLILSDVQRKVCGSYSIGYFSYSRQEEEIKLCTAAVSGLPALTVEMYTKADANSFIVR